MTKPFWQSKTFWVNTLSLAALLVDQVTPFIPAEYVVAFAATGNIINILLRSVTEKPVTLR